VTAGAAAATRRLLAIALTRQEFGHALTVNGQAGLKAPLGVRNSSHVVYAVTPGICLCGKV
jgi:hypothetical protein